MEYKKAIHDKLITDFSALTYSDNKVCFKEVQKIFISFPSGTPSCQILSTEPTVDQSMLQYDKRMYGFSAIFFDYIESNASQSVADDKIDTMSDIEDVVLDYLEKVKNNNLETAISGLKVVDIAVSAGRYSYEDSENGIRIYCSIDFTPTILVDVLAL